MEEAGHDVYRSSAEIHRTICERVIDSPFPPPPPGDGGAATFPAAGTGAPPSTSTTAPPPRRRSGNSATGNEQSGCGGGKTRGRCLALRDFYPFWRAKLEDAAAGKVLPVDLSPNPKVKDAVRRDESGLLMFLLLGANSLVWPSAGLGAQRVELQFWHDLPVPDNSTTRVRIPALLYI